MKRSFLIFLAAIILIFAGMSISRADGSQAEKVTTISEPVDPKSYLPLPPLTEREVIIREEIIQSLTKAGASPEDVEIMVKDLMKMMKRTDIKQEQMKLPFDLPLPPPPPTQESDISKSMDSKSDLPPPPLTEREIIIREEIIQSLKEAGASPEDIENMVKDLMIMMKRTDIKQEQMKLLFDIPLPPPPPTQESDQK